MRVFLERWNRVEKFYVFVSGHIVVDIDRVAVFKPADDYIEFLEIVFGIAAAFVVGHENFIEALFDGFANQVLRDLPDAFLLAAINKFDLARKRGDRSKEIADARKNKMIVLSIRNPNKDKNLNRYL